MLKNKLNQSKKENDHFVNGLNNVLRSSLDLEHKSNGSEDYKRDQWNHTDIYSGQNAVIRIGDETLSNFQFKILKKTNAEHLTTSFNTLLKDSEQFK